MNFSLFTPFAEMLVHRHYDHITDYTDEEQTNLIVAALERIHRVLPLKISSGLELDLAGFGSARVWFRSADEDYVLLSDVADQLGWHRAHAAKWAEAENRNAVQDQRRRDEERGDGRIGWEYLTDYIDLELCLAMDDEAANPDSTGRRWSHSGDWLISQNRLPWLLTNSPWGKEFVDNTVDAWAHAMQKTFGDPAGLEGLFHSNLTEEEAKRRAKRGPAIDGPGETGRL
ncbi:hypothetical protein ACWIFI_18870 [Streptomyces albidoflavus]